LAVCQARTAAGWGLKRSPYVAYPVAGWVGIKESEMRGRREVWGGKDEREGAAAHHTFSKVGAYRS